MNSNDINLFQQYFNRFTKTDKTVNSLSPALKQQGEFALLQGKLLQNILIINGGEKQTVDFINIIANSFRRSFPNHFIFKINIQRLIDENRLNLLEKFLKYFMYCNILVIENAEKTTQNIDAANAINKIIKNIHDSTQIILITNSSIEPQFPLYISLKEKAQIIKLGNNNDIHDNNDVHSNNVEFSSFAKFISEIKDEAGVKENLDESEIRSKFIEKLYVWEMKNFNVERLKNIINNSDIKKIEKEFNDFTEKIKKLIGLHKEYGLLNTQHFNEDANEIESLLFDPNSCEIITNKIKELKLRINQFRLFRNNVKIGMTISSFMPDSTNRSAYDKINQIIKGENTDILITITGSSGTGKTHLLNAIINELVNKKVILLDKTNIEKALSDEFFLKNLYEMDMLLIDNFDQLFNEFKEKEFVKQIVLSNVPIVLIMQRKYSIEDKEILQYLNSHPTFNIQPSSLFIEKTIIKGMLSNYNVPVDEIMLNYIVDNVSVSLSQADKNIRELSKITNGTIPNINQIHQVFPKKEKIKIKSMKNKFDTSNLIKFWINEQDRLYVEFED